MVSPIQGFKEMPAPAKVATVAGAAAAAASVVYAGVKGQVPDSFEGKNVVVKTAAKFGDGFKKLGTKIVTGAKKGLDAAKEKIFKKAPEAKQAVEEKGGKIADELTEVVENTANAFQG